MKRLLVLVLAAFCLGMPGVLIGQQAHPNVATGARSESLYVDSGNDQVNVFNGNLSYTIPIGEAIPVGPVLRLAPALVYNSQVWKKFQVEKAYLIPGDPEHLTYTYEPRDALAGDRIVGLGWQLHFGRLIGSPGGLLSLSPGFTEPPDLARNPDSGIAASSASTSLPVAGMAPTGLAFQSPDGSVHEFFDRLVESTSDIGTGPATWPCANYLTHGSGHCFGYTHDGSFLRLDPMDPDFGGQPVVYFPDGTKYVLGYRGGRWVREHDDTRVRAGDRACLDYAVVQVTMTLPGGTVATGPWNTTQILDPYGNAIDIAYFGQGGTTPDGTAVPSHPRAADPEAERDAIPYRAWDRAFFNLRYVEFRLADGVVPPKVQFVTVPTSSSDGGGGWRRAWYELVYSDVNTGSEVRETTVKALEAVNLPEPLTFTFGYGSLGALTSVLLPTGGAREYDYADQKFFTGQLEICQPRGVPCNPFTESHSWGVREKRTIRLVDDGTTSYSEIARTDWVRSFKEGGTCIDGGDAQYCQLRVDVWSPTDFSGSRRITRSLFHESNGARNQALYGRPMWTAEYLLPNASSVNPDPGHINGVVPAQTTYFTYDFDGAREATGVSLGNGFEHNTRTLKTRIEWADPVPSNRRYYETDHAIPGTGASSWDATSGQWGRTQVREFKPGAAVVIHRDTAETFQALTGGTPDRWILGLPTTRTVSRPSTTSDPSGANLSTTETFEYDAATGFKKARQVVGQETEGTRTLRQEWTLGTQSSGPCIATSATSPICSNRGLPTKLTEKLTGSFDGYSASSQYSRWFYYGYSALAAARDAASFYVEDRDIAPTGRPVGERGTNGRISLTDTNPQLTTTFVYDLLGRVVSVQSPGETREDIYFTPQSVTRVKAGAPNTEASRREAYFDQLGRLTRERVRLPGGAWSCRLTTYDPAGYKVGQTEWWKDGVPEIGAYCSDALNMQAKLTSGSGLVSTPGGTTWSGFDVLGRPTKTRIADGSETTDSFDGWWQQTSTRTLVAPGITTTTVAEADALGQTVAVTEPAATKADGTTPMNPIERTTYRYDHAGRLIYVRKPGSDSNGQATFTQVRTRRYDDFGWLIHQVDPEQPLFHVSQRDARGNPVRSGDYTGEIIRTFDPAGRLLNSRLASESSTYDWDGTPVTWYEVFAYDSLPGFDLGRSNGRPVWSIRANHPVTNRGTVDFGWTGATSYFHYNGLGGRLGFRQQADLLMPDNALPAPQLVSTLGATKKSKLADSFRQYFEKQNRAAKSSKDLQKAASSETAAFALALGNPSSPGGTARWSYAWDSAGRLASITYPRRDEGFATQATYQYQAGFLTSIDASFQDPFAPGLVGSVGATLVYDAPGRVLDTAVSTSARIGEVLHVTSARDASGLPRPGTWQFSHRDLDPNIRTLITLETRSYSYDPLGNITSISSTRGFPVSYKYDTRARLIQDTIAGRSVATETREYDGFGNLVKVNASALATNKGTNRLLTLASYDMAGRMIEDEERNIGRDYYPDGALMAEFSHAEGSVETLSPGGVSIWQVNGSAENVLAFWGDGTLCQTEQFRSLVRDESARLLTEYRGETEAPCVCDTPCVFRDRFYRDIVRLGPWATASYTRGVGIKLEALDHLGTPRYVTTASGTSPSFVLLDSFGAQISGTPATRELFTGHERNHTSDQAVSLPISDYMHARTYVPMLGRFTRPDPANSFSLFNPQSLNRYTYALNNPLKFIDPDGRRVVLVGSDEDRARLFQLLGTRLSPREAKSLSMDRQGVLKFSDGANLKTKAASRLKAAIDAGGTAAVLLDEQYTTKDGTRVNVRRHGGGATETQDTSASGQTEVYVLPDGWNTRQRDPADVLYHELLGHGLSDLTCGPPVDGRAEEQAARAAEDEIRDDPAQKGDGVVRVFKVCDTNGCHFEMR